jgi:hypothetical protein
MVRMTEVFNRVPLELKPDALEQKAKEMVEAFGYPDAPVDSAYGFSYDAEVRDLIKGHDASDLVDQVFETKVPSPYYFWYRHSPQTLIPRSRVKTTPASPGINYVTETTPPAIAPGEASLRLSPDGQLLRFSAYPTQSPTAQDSLGERTTPSEFSWNDILDKTSWGFRDVRETDTRGIASVPYDRSEAWKAHVAGHPGTEVHVEARTLRSQLTFLSVTVPEIHHSSWAPSSKQAWPKYVRAFMYFVLFGCALLATHNWRTQRVDRKGALRLCLIAFGLKAIVYICVGKHVFLETSAAFKCSMGVMLYDVFVVVLTYVAIEPYIRRFWPDVLVSWSRLIAGQFPDAMVGRDILVGVTAGVVNEVGQRSPAAMATWCDWSCDPLFITQLLPLQGPRVTAGIVADVLQNAIAWGLTVLAFLLVLRFCAKRTWLAGLIYVSLWATAVFPHWGRVPYSWPVYPMIALLSLWILTRFGLLAYTAFVLTAIVLQFPISVDPSLGFGWMQVLAYGTILGMAGYGFWTSTRVYDTLKSG